MKSKMKIQGIRKRKGKEQQQQQSRNEKWGKTGSEYKFKQSLLLKHTHAFIKSLLSLTSVQKEEKNLLYSYFQL